MQLTPYLGFNGQCEAAFKFYEKCLNGKITAIFPFAGSPAEAHVPPEKRNQIMHVSLAAQGAVLMGSDSPTGDVPTGNAIHVSVNLDDPVEGKRIFNALSDGGTVTMPFEETFWAAGFGMLVDRFGIPWMINCEKAG